MENRSCQTSLMSFFLLFFFLLLFFFYFFFPRMTSFPSEVVGFTEDTEHSRVPQLPG